jgi:hypothetical protein
MSETNVEIEVCQRLMDRRHVPEIRDGKVVGMREEPKYHAQIKGEPGIWAAGDSPDDAIGDLIAHHPERFGIKVTYLEGKHAR